MEINGKPTVLASGKQSIHALYSMYNYILFGNLFIAVCAVFLANYTYNSLQCKPDLRLLFLIFFSTVASYDLHAYFNPLFIESSSRIKWIREHRKLLLVSLSISLITSVCQTIYLIQMSSWILFLGVLTLLYSLPRLMPRPGRFVIVIQEYKVLYLALIWTMVTVFLPVFQSKTIINVGILILSVNRYFFILQVCFLFDYRDKYLLKQNQRDSFLKRINESKFDLIFYCALILVIITSLMLALMNRQMSGLLSMLIAEIAVFVILINAKATRSDYWYSTLVDGLLMLPGMIMLISSALMGRS